MVKQTGYVAKWLNHRGIGFITPEGQESEEGKDYLVHFEHIKQHSEDGFKSLAQGQIVEFELETDKKNPDNKIAVKVTGPDGADCERKPKGKGKGKGRGKGKGKGGKGSREEKAPHVKADHTCFEDMEGERKTGTVAKWLNHKGIGYITMDGHEPDVSDLLVHFEQIKQGGPDDFVSLKQDSKVEFTLKKDPKHDGVFIAVDVTGPDGADCEARAPKGGKGNRKGNRQRQGGDDSDEE